MIELGARAVALMIISRLVRTVILANVPARGESGGAHADATHTNGCPPLAVPNHPRLPAAPWPARTCAHATG